MANYPDFPDWEDALRQIVGANTFVISAKGKTPRAAFDAARKQALYDHGHGGYSGTIAEKDSFVVIAPPKEAADKTSRCNFASRLLDEGDPRVDDKWGPAGCIELAADEFLFFGWASS